MRLKYARDDYTFLRLFMFQLLFSSSIDSVKRGAVESYLLFTPQSH